MIARPSPAGMDCDSDEYRRAVREAVARAGTPDPATLALLRNICGWPVGATEETAVGCAA